MSVAGILGLFCAAIFWLSAAALRTAFDANLKKDLGVLEREFGEEIAESAFERAPDRTVAVGILREVATTTLANLRLAGFAAEFRLGARGETLLGQLQMSSDQASALARARDRIGTGNTDPFDLPRGHRGAVGENRALTGVGPVIVVLVEDTAIVERPLARIRNSLFALALFGMLLALGGGYVIADRALRPIDSMGRQAALLAQAGAVGSHRLQVSNQNDELGRLAAAFNDLLKRLDLALLQMKRFVEDAAHELRTPVSVVRGEAELALSRDRTGAEYQDSLQTIAGESALLSRLVRDLTLLAEGEGTDSTNSDRLVDLDEIVADSVRSLRSASAERGVQLELRGQRGIQLNGDERLLREIVSNLLSNAIKFTAERSRVRIDLSCGEVGAEIRVSDEAPTIPESERERVFERFYRGAAARAGEIEGSGLGLAIARWAAERHGARVRVEARVPAGNVFVVEIPARRVAGGTAA